MSGKYEAFGRVLDRCESYIERRFVVALLFSERFTFEPGARGRIVDKAGVFFDQQVTIGAYRADFTLTHPGARKKIVVELDGLEHHGTKDAAERDRVRDRDLLERGWTTVRFAGRELTRDALACARQAMKLLEPYGPVAKPPPPPEEPSATPEQITEGGMRLARALDALDDDETKARRARKAGLPWPG